MFVVILCFVFLLCGNVVRGNVLLLFLKRSLIEVGVFLLDIMIGVIVVLVKWRRFFFILDCVLIGILFLKRWMEYLFFL